MSAAKREKRKTPPEGRWDAMREAKLDDLAAELEALRPEEADRRLDAEGGDAAGTRRRAAAQVADIDARHARMGAWQAEARAKKEVAAAALAAVRAKRPKMTRGELEARVAALRAGAASTAWAQPVATFFRKRTTDETTDEELLALLDEVEALGALAETKTRGPKGGAE